MLQPPLQPPVLAAQVLEAAIDAVDLRPVIAQVVHHESVERLHMMDVAGPGGGAEGVEWARWGEGRGIFAAHGRWCFMAQGFGVCMQWAGVGHY